MDNLSGKRGQRRIKSLLLLVNLFVARTLCDCPKPVLKENTVLTNEALLMNEFPNNVKIALTCANGYVKDSGSGMMECTDGTWGDLDLTCKKKDCGIPVEPPHTHFDYSKGTLFGAVVFVSCDKGYYVEGSAYKHCFNSGWTGKSTKCLILMCDMPATIPNGRNSWVSDDYPKYGESIKYTCNEGHTLSGNESITCSDDGEYDSTAPQCQGVIKGDAFTTTLVTTPTSTTTPPTQETSATSTASATNTSSGHRDRTLTASATPTVSLSARGGDILTSVGTTTTILSPTTSQGNGKGDIVDTKTDVGYTPVIISVVCVTLAACVVVLLIHKLLLKKKGSPNGTVPIC